jgi:hypothetical protein
MEIQRLPPYHYVYGSGRKSLKKVITLYWPLLAVDLPGAPFILNGHIKPRIIELFFVNLYFFWELRPFFINMGVVFPDIM